MSNSRMDRYVPVVIEYAARIVLFHTAAAQRLGLHPTDLKCLRLLGEKTMTAGELAQHTGLTGAAVTAMIDRLEVAGYVSRQRESEDRRKVTVHAVPRAIQKVNDLYQAHQERMAKLLAGYSDREFAAIMSFLENTSDLLEFAASELAPGAKAAAQ